MGRNGKTIEPASVLKANVTDNILSLFRAVTLSMVVMFDFNVNSSSSRGGSGAGFCQLVNLDRAFYKITAGHR